MPLTINWPDTLLSAGIGLALILILTAAVFLVLRALGFRVLWRKRGKPTHVRTVTPKQSKSSDYGEDLSEEELILILTAAAMATLDTSDVSRFRVVAFRRI